MVTSDVFSILETLSTLRHGRGNSATQHWALFKPEVLNGSAPNEVPGLVKALWSYPEMINSFSAGIFAMSPLSIFICAVTSSGGKRLIQLFTEMSTN